MTYLILSTLTTAFGFALAYALSRHEIDAAYDRGAKSRQPAIDYLEEAIRRGAECAEAKAMRMPNQASRLTEIFAEGSQGDACN